MLAPVHMETADTVGAFDAVARAESAVQDAADALLLQDRRPCETLSCTIKMESFESS